MFFVYITLNVLPNHYFSTPTKDHEKINLWKREQQLVQTLKKRKELINYDTLTEENITYLKTLKKNKI